jgi:HK97 family phage portal protein
VATSALRRPRNDTPVPYVAKRESMFSRLRGNTSPAESQLQAMTAVGTLFAIVDANATACSQVEWNLYRKSKSGKPEDRVIVTEHQAWKVFNRPNNFTTRQELIEIGTQHGDLTGETWWVVARDKRSRIPLELWPVRPDRMRPNEHAVKFIDGYTYTTPDGQELRLENDEVIFIRRPSPLDPYRGIGPVQAILADIESTQAAAEWNKNFFRNSAEPGGIIEVPEMLGDAEFNQMRDRWNENHRGTGNAHRVAILEHGKWVDRKYTMRDMQFSELRGVSREIIREAFRFPKPMLGTVEDVNRANAEAAEVVFARWHTAPRCERFKQALNNDFLPLFSAAGVESDLEFDYEVPLPEDRAVENATRESKAKTAEILINLGFSAADVMEMLELPNLPYEKPAAPVQLAPPAPEIAPEDDEDPGNVLTALTRGRAVAGPQRHKPWFGNEGKIPEDELPDLSTLQDDWRAQLDQLVAQWEADVLPAQYEELRRRVEDIVSSGSVAELQSLQVPSESGAEQLQQAMAILGLAAAVSVVQEAAAQGVDVQPVIPRSDELAPVAQATAGLLANGLALSAAREAMRVWGPGAKPEDVAAAVAEQLNSLTDAQPRQFLGSALTRAQRTGRILTLKAAPTTAWYASEQLDQNTCKECKSIHRKWLGNSILENVNRLYPTGGYRYCLGRERCRGMVVGVWRPKQVGDE